jgi:hypothetical protein
METAVGVGYSAKRNPSEAGKEAALKALERAGIAKPDFVFVFATVGYDQKVLIHAIREATSNAPLSGCSGEGVITQGTAEETNFGVAVMTIRSDELTFHHARVKEIGKSAHIAGERLAADIKPFVAADSIACFLFADGLALNFDPFLAAFQKTLEHKGTLPLFGGLAADNWTSLKTYQYHDDDVFSDGISCVVMSGKGDIAWGVDHGCTPVGAKRTITRGKGNIINEIDGMPVLNALKEYTDENDTDDWNKTSLNLCLGFKTPELLKKTYGDYIVRYMMGRNTKEGSVTIQSDVQEGADLWIVRRDKELMKSGVRTIAARIKDKVGSKRPKFVLHFECVGRGKVVFNDKEKHELLVSLQKDIGEDIPWLGFYGYGEIGPIEKQNCFHNFTSVVAAIY